MEAIEDSAEIEIAARKFIEFIQSGKLKFRAHPSQNIHAKVYITRFKDDDRDFGRVVTGSSNFSENGLIAQREFPDLTKIDLLTIYEDVYAPVVPRDNLAEFIYHGDVAQEHDATAQLKTQREDYKGSYQHKIPENVRKYAQQIDDALAHVKICDPAIGSGAFPVGVMNEIVRARGVLNAYLGDAGRTPYDFKRHAIQESIYGVDLEPSAVDIAKLRLWLSLVVDEDDFGTIKPLPNLEYKVRIGDSLLGVDIHKVKHLVTGKYREFIKDREDTFARSFPIYYSLDVVDDEFPQNLREAGES